MQGITYNPKNKFRQPIQRLPLVALLLAVCTCANLYAQQPGANDEQGEAPKLEVEAVVITGTRVVKLPPARKGEALDTSLYVIPSGDTVIFGDRISSLSGPGGALPGYDEFAIPFRINAEASVGSYLSPHAMLYGEYIHSGLDLAGTIDYSSTEGHVDSANASSFLLDLNGGWLLSGDFPGAQKVRLGAGFEYQGDDYTLYGNQPTPYDRSRSSMQIDFGVESKADALVGYQIGLGITNANVEDVLNGQTTEASALSPTFGFGFMYGGDSLRGGLDFVYSTTSLKYSMPTETPAFMKLQGEVEWWLSENLFMTLGGLYANGQHSDSGSSTLLLPRASVRLDVNPELSLYAWYAPELRAPSYRNRIMDAPYVNSEIVLRPERVPVNIAIGARANIEGVAIDGRAVLQGAENTPVVTAGAAAGELIYGYAKTRTLGLEGSAGVTVANVDLLGELAIRASVDDATDEQLPMIPEVEFHGRADYRIDEALGIYGTVDVKTSRRTALDVSGLTEELQTVPAQFVLGAGATYNILGHLQAFGGITNLLNTEYDVWQNYSAPGLEVRAGLRATF